MRAPRWLAPNETRIVLAYHRIFGTYRFWLANGPRGSGFFTMPRDLTARVVAPFQGFRSFIGTASQGVALGWRVLPRWGKGVAPPGSAGSNGGGHSIALTVARVGRVHLRPLALAEQGAYFGANELVGRARCEHRGEIGGESGQDS